MARNNGETFQKQAFLTFVQLLGTLCFKQNLIHRVGSGVRPEEASRRAQNVSVSTACRARAGKAVGQTLTVGTPKGGIS